MIGQIFNLLVGLGVGSYFIMLGLGMKVEPSKLRGHKIFIGLGAFIILAGITLTILEMNVSSIPIPLTPEQFVADLKSKVTFPVQTDPTTRMDSVEAAEKRIIFRFTITADNKEDFARKVDQYRKFLLSEGCKSQKRVLISGIAVEMNYVMAKDFPTDKILITPTSCGY